jgi:hypothetical protein
MTRTLNPQFQTLDPLVEVNDYGSGSWSHQRQWSKKGVAEPIRVKVDCGNETHTCRSKTQWVQIRD